MSDTVERGKLSQKVCYEFEWTIQDFWYTSEDMTYTSPRFSIPGSEWYLKLFQNGECGDILPCSLGWIDLYLAGESDNSSTPKSVNYSLGVKKADGKVEVISYDLNYVFDKKKSLGSGLPILVQTSQLRKRRHELAQFSTLTVTCSMRVIDVFDCKSRLIELSEDLKNMFEWKEGCDATLKVQKKKFPVHRSVLASRSTVFRTMFRTDMKEKKMGVVEIDDCHPDSFKDFLVFIYSGRFENSSGDIFGLYNMAHKYGVDSLKPVCVQSMLDNLSIDNVLDVSVSGHLFDEPQLKDKSQEFFNERFADVFLTEKFSTLFTENPTLVKDLITNMAKGMKDKSVKK